MKHTQQIITEKTKKILKDLRGEYYSDSSVGDAIFDEEKIIFTGENKGKKHPVWTIDINSFFDNVDFLHISDETGEPIYYQNFNTIVFEVKKDSDGKYYRTVISES